MTEGQTDRQTETETSETETVLNKFVSTETEQEIFPVPRALAAGSVSRWPTALSVNSIIMQTFVALFLAHDTVSTAREG